MRRRNMLWAAALSLALGSAAQAADRACAAGLGDAPAVTAAVDRMYDALRRDDAALFDTVVEPGFYAYDVGKVFRGHELVELIKAGKAAGRRYVWTITNPEVHIDCDTAWIAYVNEGAVGDAAGMKPQQWLESAFLRKTPAGWRITFFHSTRVAPAAP